MLKLTEAELAEMGFRRDWDEWWTWMIGNHSAYLGCKQVNGEWSWAVSDADNLMYCYPQTKEDLLTLIRLFTPPKDSQ